MGKEMIYSNGAGREKEPEPDVYSLIRSAEVREYYRRENVCDNWEKKVILIQNGFISVQQKAAMLRQLSGTGTEEENRLTEEMCRIYSRYTDMIYHPQVRTLFVVESGQLWWYEQEVDDNLSFDSVYESLEEVVVHMEEVCGGENREEYHAHVTVLHVPPDEKVKEVFCFILDWIDGKWEIREIRHSWNTYANDNDLKLLGISDDAIDLFYYSGWHYYHPLPFENGCRIKFQLPFMEKPVYGTLESELDGLGCWYHFLNLDEMDGVSWAMVNLTKAELDGTDGYSSLDWIERA